MTREVTAVTEQIGELDRVLPALAANEEAPFAMTVRGATYRERAEAAPALLDSLRRAYVDGKRYGNTKDFPIAELRGVQVRPSRMLSSDEMIVSVNVPGRTCSIQVKDFTGVDAAAIGLVRRVENMVADTANYRDELVRRHGTSQESRTPTAARRGGPRVVKTLRGWRRWLPRRRRGRWGRAVRRRSTRSWRGCGRSCWWCGGWRRTCPGTSTTSQSMRTPPGS